LIKFSGQPDRFVDLLLGGNTPARRFVRSVRTAEMVHQRNRERIDQPANGGALDGLHPVERPDLEAEITTLVDELTPELAGIPPSVVRTVVAETDQEAENQSVQDSGLGAPFDMGQVLKIDNHAHQQAISGQETQARPELESDLEWGKQTTKRIAERG